MGRIGCVLRVTSDKGRHVNELLRPPVPGSSIALVPWRVAAVPGAWGCAGPPGAEASPWRDLLAATHGRDAGRHDADARRNDAQQRQRSHLVSQIVRPAEIPLVVPEVPDRGPVDERLRDEPRTVRSGG